MRSQRGTLPRNPGTERHPSQSSSSCSPSGVQHECDHLIGKLYPMRVRDFTQFGYTEVLFPGISAAEED
jgi:hypothetical protein